MNAYVIEECNCDTCKMIQEAIVIEAKKDKTEKDILRRAEIYRHVLNTNQIAN